MIRTGDEYRDSLRDGREVYMDGVRVDDVTTHPMFKPLVDVRARIYDMQHDPATREVMTVERDGERNAVGNALPFTRDDWWAKRRATDAVLEEIGGIVTRVGDETVGEMWSLYDGRDVLSEIDPRFAENIETHIGAIPEGRPLPRLREHRPEGRPVQAPAGAGPGHAPATRSGRRTPASWCAGPSTRPPPPTPTRRSRSRRSPIGATRRSRTTPWASSATWAPRA